MRRGRKGKGKEKRAVRGKQGEQNAALLLDEYSMILNSECQMLRYSG